MTGDFTQVPIVDFGDFAGGSVARRQALGAEMAAICSQVGFFYLANHGVPAAKVDNVFAEVKRFFDLPLADKQALGFRNSRTRRGYMGEQEENFARDRGEPGDLKEIVNMGLDYPAEAPEVLARRPFYGGNQWPSDLPGWREAMLGYLDGMVGLGCRVMQAVALGLDLPQTRFDRMLERSMSSLRILHYPAQAARPAISGAPGCGAHSDYGCLTLLAQDDVGGLQVQTRSGNWVDAPSIPGTFVINIGDLLAYWTDGRFRSTPHRVTTPTARSRYSVATFLQPHIDTPLTSLTGAGARSQVLTAGEHYLRSINNAYAA
jgi:isopenicillin N synthase-like dioxygenase